VLFFASSRHLPGQCLKSGHDCFVPCSFQLVARQSCSHLRHYVEALTVPLDKRQVKNKQSSAYRGFVPYVWRCVYASAYKETLQYRKRSI
jgi:hypothetical protein